MSESDGHHVRMWHWIVDHCLSERLTLPERRGRFLEKGRTERLAELGKGAMHCYMVLRRYEKWDEGWSDVDWRTIQLVSGLSNDAVENGIWQLEALGLIKLDSRSRSYRNIYLIARDHAQRRAWSAEFCQKHGGDLVDNLFDSGIPDYGVTHRRSVERNSCSVDCSAQRSSLAPLNGAPIRKTNIYQHNHNQNIFRFMGGECFADAMKVDFHLLINMGVTGAVVDNLLSKYESADIRTAVRNALAKKAEWLCRKKISQVQKTTHRLLEKAFNPVGYMIRTLEKSKKPIRDSPLVRKHQAVLGKTWSESIKRIEGTVIASGKDSPRQGTFDDEAARRDKKSAKEKK